MLKQINDSVQEFTVVHAFQDVSYKGEICTIGLFTFYPDECDESDFLSHTVYGKESFEFDNDRMQYESIKYLRVSVSVYALDDATAISQAYQLFEFLENVCNVFPDDVEQMISLINPNDYIPDYCFTISQGFVGHQESMRCTEIYPFEQRILGKMITKWCLEHSQSLLETSEIPSIERSIILAVNMLGSAKRLGKTAQSFLLIRSAIESVCTKIHLKNQKDDK